MSDTDGMDFLAELDAEIQKAASATSLKSRKDKLVKHLRDRRIAPAIFLELNAELSIINAELRLIQWRTVASVAMFAEQKCLCGSTHYIFLQHMREEATIAKPDVKRWSVMPREIESMPKKTMLQKSKTSLCIDCLEWTDYDLNYPDKILHGQITRPPKEIFPDAAETT